MADPPHAIFVPRGLLPMSVNTKRVFYVKYLSHSIFADLLAARPDVFAPGRPTLQRAGE